MDFIKKTLPGLLVTTIIAIVATVLAANVSFIHKIGSVSTAILLGIIVGNTIPLPKIFTQGIKFSEKKLLNVAIMMLGFNLSIASLLNLGFKTILIIIAVQTITIFSGILLGRLFGFSKNASTLLGVGNAVCGSSAIAAVSPVVDANESDTGISIGVVNFLGTVGIFVLPFLALKILSFDNIQTATLIGGSLQAVGQVVASGFSVNAEVGQYATIIKMARILMLGPIVLIFSMFNKQSKSSNNTKKTLTSYVPGFVIFFIIFCLFRSASDLYIHLPENTWKYLKLISHSILTIAMVSIGMKIKFKDLLSQGPKAILVGLLVMIIQLIALVTLISLFIQ